MHRKCGQKLQKTKQNNPQPRKALNPAAFPPAPRLLSGPFSVTGEVILWLRWARRTVAARREQRSRRIYHWTACQGDYWIKITIWHFSFSVLAQWTEGKLLQPSMPSSMLLIASLAPLQPLREKSFCQNITQCTDPPPRMIYWLSDRWGAIPQSFLLSFLPLSYVAPVCVCLQNLEPCRLTRLKLRSRFKKKTSLQCGLFLIFYNLLKDDEEGSVIVQSYKLMNWNFGNFLRVKASKSSASCLRLCHIRAYCRACRGVLYFFPPNVLFLAGAKGWVGNYYP